jgi:hypothetical protein
MLNRLINVDTNIEYILILRIVTTRVHVVFQSWAVNKRFFRIQILMLALQYI